jgi:hypothetical protein
VAELPGNFKNLIPQSCHKKVNKFIKANNGILIFIQNRKENKTMKKKILICALILMFLAFAGSALGDNADTNIFLGDYAGYQVDGGYFNTFIGYEAGYHGVYGNYNVALGYEAGYSNIYGNFNTALGYEAGYKNTNGTGNVFLGSLAGFNETGSNKLYIDNTDTVAPLIYGDFNTNIININGNLGIGKKAPAYPIQTAGGAYCTGRIWVNASSREYKDDIKALSRQDAFNALEGLNPVTFVYKNDRSEQHVGFIAEDVPQLVATKDRKGISSMDIVSVLTKVVQEQQKTIVNLQEELNELKGRIR